MVNKKLYGLGFMPRPPSISKSEAKDRILALLRERPASLGEIVETLGLPKATVYRYLKEMEAEGIVKRRRRGEWVITSFSYEDYVRKILAPSLKEVIGTRKDVAEELLKTLSEDEVLAIKRGIEGYARYIEKRLKEGRALPILYAEVTKMVISHHGLMLLSLLELAKVYHGIKLLIEALDLTNHPELNKVKDKIKKELHEAIKKWEEIGLEKIDRETVKKVEALLRELGYDGTLKLKTPFGFSIRVPLTALLDNMVEIEHSERVVVVMELANTLFETGRGPLREEEIKKLLKVYS